MIRLFPLTLAALCLTAPASAQIPSFQHIIIVIQENRSPDNFFQGLCTPTITNPTSCSTAPSGQQQQYNIQTANTGWADKTSKTGFTTDILTTCKLRDVSWVTPDGKNSDHAGYTNRTGGPSWVASIVNAVGQSTCTNPSDGSSYWESTAIIITWDDWGGWYDHVAPMIQPYPYGGFEMGFRVPLIVVSAYTPARFISNMPEDFGSVARFIEHNFGITEGALTFADARGGASDLSEYFSLVGNAARTFQPISAPLPAQHFIDTPPSGDPPDDE